MSKLSTLEDYYKQRDLIYDNLFNEYKNLVDSDSDSDCNCQCCQMDKNIQKKYKKQLLDLIQKYNKTLPETLPCKIYTFSEISRIVLGFLNFLNEMPGPIARTYDKVFNTELNNKNVSSSSTIYLNYNKKSIGFGIVPKRHGNVHDDMNNYSYNLAKRCIETITDIIQCHILDNIVHIGYEDRCIQEFYLEDENDGQFLFYMDISEPMSEKELELFFDCQDFYEDILNILKCDERIYRDIFSIINKFVCD
jgi:hypothetical protein